MSAPSNKPTRTFTICTAPVVGVTEGAFEVIQPAMLHEIRGCEIKYIAAGEFFLHVVDAVGSVVFACAAHNVLWSKQENPSPKTSLKLI